MKNNFMKYILILLCLVFVSNLSAQKTKTKSKIQEFTFFKDFPFQFNDDYSGKVDSIMKNKYQGKYNKTYNKYDQIVYEFVDWYIEYNQPFEYEIENFSITTDKDGNMTMIAFTLIDDKQLKAFTKLLKQNSKKIKDEQLEEYVYRINDFDVSILLDTHFLLFNLK